MGTNGYHGVPDTGVLDTGRDLSTFFCSSVFSSGSSFFTWSKQNHISDSDHWNTVCLDFDNTT